MPAGTWTSDDSGRTNAGALVSIVLLVIALVAVVFLWQRDADSQDPSIEVDIGSQLVFLGDRIV